jgi:pimeloyl-ACP methyl ester carboxylesterase
VGHSLGGLMVRVYANRYPGEVAGMLLVDSSHENQLIIIMDRTTKKAKVVRWRELSTGRPIPPVRSATPAPADSNASAGATQSAVQSKLSAPYDKLPFKIRQMRLWAMSRPSYDAARGSETFEFLADELAGLHDERGGRKYPLGGTPLIVLTRGIAGEDERANEQLLEDHDRLQADLLSLSSNSKQIIARHSGHHIQLEEPALVAGAIKQVVNAVRRKSKLIP